MSQIHVPHTYEAVLAFAKNKAAEVKESLPVLPTDNQLQPYKALMYHEDSSLVEAVSDHLFHVGQAHGHGFEEHILWVAVRAAYVASQECEEHAESQSLRQEIVKRAWRLGLLHDLERWRGYGKDHMIHGSTITREMLQTLKIHDNYLPEMVALHDEMNVSPKGTVSFDLPFFSLFAVDHLNWGLEWEETKWKEYYAKQVPLEQAIHEYHFMETLVQSPNLQQTRWGKEVVVPYINFGLELAKFVEQAFL